MTSQADKDRLLADEDAVTAAEAASKIARDKLAADTAALIVDGAPPPPPPPPPNPTITGFAVTPTTVTAGQPVVLSATVANATQVTLDGVPITLPYTHTPIASRSYQLVASGAAGTTPATSPSIAVTVSAIIPPPSGMPAWVPPMNTVGKVSDSTVSMVDPGPGPWDTGTGSNRAVMDNWGSGCLATDYSPYGLKVALGGGHDGYWGNEFYGQDMSANVPVWVRMIDPSPNCTRALAANPGFDLVHGEFPDGTPGVPHLYGEAGYLSRAMGGGLKGSVIFMVGTYWWGLNVAGFAHRGDLAAPKWWRASGNSAVTGQESSWALDTKRRQYVGTRTGPSAPNDVLRVLGNFDANGVGVHSDLPMHADFTMGSDASACYAPTQDAYMMYGSFADGPKAGTFGIRAWDRANGEKPYDLNIVGAALPIAGGVGFLCWEELNCLFIRSSLAGDEQKLWRIDAPPTGPWQTGVWPSTLIIMAGIPVVGYEYNGLWGRFDANKAAGCLTWVTTTTTPTYAYRVAPGT